MKKVKLLAVVLIMSVSIFTKNALLAHTEMSEAMPANGAVMHEGPEHVMLNFTGAVRLLQFSVIDSASHAVDTGFRPSANAAEAFTLMVPALTADTYTVQWTVMGDDSHRVEGEFSFTVDPMAAETMGADHDMSEHHDAH